MSAGLQFQFSWMAIEVSEGCNYCFPQPISPSMKRRYSGPAVYRWKLIDNKGQLKAIYYGECASLAKRVNGYLRPSAGNTPGRGQMANLRLKARFDEEIAAGSQVSLDVLQFEAFALNGVEFIAGQLSNPFLRKVLENLFLCERLPSCCELLNRSYVDGRRAKVAEILADIVPGATQRDIRVLLKELESTKTQS